MNAHRAGLGCRAPARTLASWCAAELSSARLLCAAVVALSLVTCLALQIPQVCLASPEGISRDDFDEDQAEQFVRSLLKDHRYAEALGYLRSELEGAPTDAVRQRLLVLLTDCQLEVGDYQGAWKSLAEAEALGSDPSLAEEIASRKKDLLKREESALAGSAPSGSARQAAGGPRVAGVDSLGGLVGAEAAAGEELSPGAAGPAEEAPPQALVSNSFFETDLRQVLTDLSLQTGVPIVWDASVQGLVTFEAKDQPLDDVLASILLPAGYAFTFQSGKYFVGSSKPEDPAFGLLSKTEVMTLSNIDAAEAISLLSDYFKPFVKASKKANLVCITAPPATLERIVQDIEALDGPPLQLLLEVVVTEISGDNLRKMGLDWRLSHTSDEAVWSVATKHAKISDAALVGGYAGADVSILDRTVDLAASLEMLLQTGKAKIRANPRITTLNGRTAEIGLMTDQYFIIATSVSQYYQYNTLQSISSGIKMEITPYASRSGSITVYVKPEVGDVVGSGAEGLPEITKRTASTSVRVKDGETFAVGGLNIQNEKHVKRGVPILAQIPLLGYLFRYDERQVSDTEIVIFVTPHIIED